MSHRITDIIDVLSENTYDCIINEIIYLEGYKKDERKKELAQEYRKSRPKSKHIESDNQTYIQKPLTKKEHDKLYRLIHIMDKDDISDKSHKAAVNIYNNTIDSPKNSSVSTQTLKLGNGKTVKFPTGIQKKDNRYEISTRTYKEGKEIELKPSDKLYHSSTVDNLTELKPTLKAKDGVHYSSKRIYFWINKMGTRMGSSESKEHIYELINKPKTVKVDTELGGGAVYIDTNIPLKVKKIK